MSSQGSVACASPAHDDNQLTRSEGFYTLPSFRDIHPGLADTLPPEIQAAIQAREAAHSPAPPPPTIAAILATVHATQAAAAAPAPPASPDALDENLPPTQPYQP